MLPFAPATRYDFPHTSTLARASVLGRMAYVRNHPRLEIPRRLDSPHGAVCCADGPGRAAPVAARAAAGQRGDRPRGPLPAADAGPDRDMGHLEDTPGRLYRTARADAAGVWRPVGRRIGAARRLRGPAERADAGPDLRTVVGDPVPRPTWRPARPPADPGVRLASDRRPVPHGRLDLQVSRADAKGPAGSSDDAAPA